MINSLSKYKKAITLEGIGRTLLFISLLSLLFRSGSFYTNFLPKPFELIFGLVLMVTLTDLLIYREKIGGLIKSVPMKMWAAIIGLFVFVTIGFVINTFINAVPFHLETVIEFSRLGIAVLLFLLVVYYSRDYLSYRLFFYALIFPVVEIVFLVIRSQDLILAGRFIGFTNNVNATAKMILMPTLFFVTLLLINNKKGWLRWFYFVIAASLFALVFWIGSRGALIGLSAGIVFIISSLFFTGGVKKAVRGSLAVLFLVIAGFIFTPYSGKQIILNRSLNKDVFQTNYVDGLSQLPLLQIVKNSEVFKFGVNRDRIEDVELKVDESRLGIWSYYIKRAVRSPFGLGPAYNYDQQFYNSSINGYMMANSHSTYLEIFLWGGVGAFLCFIYIIYFVFRRLRDKLIGDNINIYITTLSATIIAFLVALMVDSTVASFWLWTLFALAIAKPQSIISSEPTSSS